MARVINVVYWILLIGAFALAGLAIWEKVANVLGLTVLRGPSPSKILEVSVMVLIFVIALQLHGIRTALQRGGPDK
jgi:hypothetical protein